MLYRTFWPTGFSTLDDPLKCYNIPAFYASIYFSNPCHGYEVESLFYLFASPDSYSVNGGSGENAFGRKSLGQELRVNNVSPDFTVQHGNRALATKDMRKSQGMLLSLRMVTP